MAGGYDVRETNIQVGGRKGGQSRRRQGSRCWCPATTRKWRSPRSSRDFRAALPDATIFVFDNNSTDNTAAAARAAGAEVFREKHQGKGFVVRRMFTDVEADIYVLVDGDATYDAPSAPVMIAAPARRPARHGGGQPHRPGSGRLSRRPSRRQPAAHRASSPRCSARPSTTCCRATGCSRAAS